MMSQSVFAPTQSCSVKMFSTQPLVFKLDSYSLKIKIKIVYISTVVVVKPDSEGSFGIPKEEIAVD